ncbi:MAG: 2-hydroxyacyl-CoA dehydratase family protein [Candidatus Xenobiia bacterium LiM19]
MRTNQRIGITTTIPVEVIFAAGLRPVDLNNIFITHKNPHDIIERAECRGFPRTLCSWVKGIYGVLQEVSDVKAVVAVIEGDCSNSIPLLEILRREGREVIPFSYPYDRDRKALTRQIENLMNFFGVDWPEVMQWKTRLDQVRKTAHTIDAMTWNDDRITGFENHLHLVNCSDFLGDPDYFSNTLEAFLRSVEERPHRRKPLKRLGYIGVPPIFSDLHDYLEEKGAGIVFNEVQRQFALPFDTDDLIEKYSLYTYPYNFEERISDILAEIDRRGIEGIIHYTQVFCHHQMEHMLLREHIKVPLLMLEGDRPGSLDARTKLRIESFLEMTS